MTGKNDYLLEKRLQSAAPELHRRAGDCVFGLQHMLSAFLNRFPDFTDHSLLHSLDVLNFCNQLLGAEQVQALTPEECYVLIMACYLHDVGMGIGDRDFSQFSKEIDFGDYFRDHGREDTARIVRDFHNEYSGLFIRKHAALFEIPSEELLFAVIQVSRGHRKTDLLDPIEYPDLPAERGAVRTAFLSAVVRLADEIDVASERNPELLFDTSRLTQQRDIEVFGTHESIKSVEVTEKQIILHVSPKSPEYVPLIRKLAGKIQETLDYCRDVAEKRSSLHITQEETVIRPE